MTLSAAMLDFPFFTEGRSPAGVLIRGTRGEGLDVDAPTMWWASLDGEAWVLIGSTSHEDIERAYVGAPRDQVQTYAARCGWRWGEVRTVAEAMERMDKRDHTHVELTRFDVYSRGGAHTVYVTDKVETRDTEGDDGKG